MEWTGDVASGDWLKPLIDDPWRGTMHDVVPRGFEAYARVFHPVDSDDEPLRWAQVADAFGTTMHPLAQWNALVRAPLTSGAQQVAAPDGRTIDGPSAGQLDAGILTLLARVLQQHTTTPDAGAVAVWEGWGDLVGSMRLPSANATFGWLSGRGVQDAFNDAFRRETWHDGILPRDVSEGPRLRLPGREHVLFSGGISEFAAADWERRVPWRDVVDEQHGDESWAYSPSIVWPDDHAWVLVTEVDWDSTVVAGSRSLVDALCATPGIEALETPRGASLQYDADEINR